MTIQKNNRMELLSWSYVEAVAASIGVQLTKPPIDNHSVDGTFISSDGKCPRLDFQLKSTSVNSFTNDELSFALPVKNYHDLRRETFTPQILILLLMPNNESEWLEHSHDALMIRNCAYWKSLLNEDDTNNTNTINVKFDKRAHLSPEALKGLLTKIEKEEAL